MTLDLRTLTWAYVDLRDPWGRRVQLNLHGLALVRAAPLDEGLDRG